MNKVRRVKGYASLCNHKCFCSGEVNASGSDSPVSNTSEEVSRSSSSRTAANDSTNNTNNTFLPGPNKVALL